QAYVTTITREPGQSRSVLHFVVLGQMVTAATSGATRAAVESVATQLATAPVIGDLTAAEICSIDNFSASALSAHGFDFSVCRRKHPGDDDSDDDGQGGGLTVRQPPVPEQPDAQTSVKYDVVGRTIQRLRADMESGVTTSAEITRAYLDRIEAYDRGQFGFHSYELVADDAM